MTQTKTVVTVRKPGEHVRVLDIQGEVSSAAENAFADAFARAGEPGVRVLILNFAGVGYMNSTGIGLLVTLLIRANRQGQRLIAVGLSDHYRRIFELTRLNEAIRSYGSEVEALEASGAA